VHLSVTRSWPHSASPNSLDHGLQVYTTIAFRCISKLARLRPPSASLSFLDLGLQVHLSVQLDLSLPVHLQIHSITASKSLSKFTRSQPPSASLHSLTWRLQALLWLHSSTVCSQIDRMYIFRNLDRWSMPYYDVTNLVTVTKTNMIDEMPFSYGTLRNYYCENTAPSLLPTCAKVSADPKFYYPISQLL